MDWKEKIKIGMKLIAKGCNENQESINCSECPFDIFCVSLAGAGRSTPELDKVWKDNSR